MATKTSFWYHKRTLQCWKRYSSITTPKEESTDMAVKCKKEAFKKPETLICLRRKNWEANSMPFVFSEELHTSTSFNMHAFISVQCCCVYCHQHKATCRWINGNGSGFGVQFYFVVLREEGRVCLFAFIFQMWFFIYSPLQLCSLAMVCITDWKAVPTSFHKFF